MTEAHPASLKILRNLSAISSENLDKAGFTKEGYNYYSYGRIFVLIRKSTIFIDIKDEENEIPISGIHDMEDLMHLIRLVG